MTEQEMMAMCIKKLITQQPLVLRLNVQERGSNYESYFVFVPYYDLL